MAPDLPDPWRAFLHDVDALLQETVCLHCLGGFVVTIRYGLSRATADLDVLECSPWAALPTIVRQAGKGSPLYQKHRVYIEVVPVAPRPYNYEDRLTEMFPGTLEHLRLFALDPYDLALTKIERNSSRDRDDVVHLAETVPLDLSVLQERYQEELRPYLGRPDREDPTLRLWIEMIEERRPNRPMAT